MCSSHYVEKNLADEIKELNKRISELEKMLSILMQPLRDVGKTASNYLRLTGLLLDHGGLTPDIILKQWTRCRNQLSFLHPKASHPCLDY